jgi:hypothetical protein
MDELLRKMASEEVARAQEGMDEKLRQMISEEVARAQEGMEKKLRQFISEEVARAQEGIDERLRRIVSEGFARAHFSVQQGPWPSEEPETVEYELQQLMSEMMEMKLGLRKACVPFCRSLAEQGVMSLKHLPKDSDESGSSGRKVYESARAILQKTGMQQVQVDRVVAVWVGADECHAFSLFD